MRAVFIYAGIVAVLLGAALFVRDIPRLQGGLIAAVLLLFSGGITFFLARPYK